MKTIKEMTAEVAQVNVEKGWRETINTFGEYCALLHSEISEALEAWREYGLTDMTSTAVSGAGVVLDHPKPEGVGSEMADLLIRLVDTCDVLGIDLEAEYERKLAYNRTRPYQHGGKTL